MKRCLTVTFSVLLLLMATLYSVSFAESLVAYFPFDGDVKDASGNSNHGEIVGTHSYVEGKFGKAIELNNGVYVEIEASDSLHGDFFKAAPFTISAWIYPKASTYYGHLWRSLPVSAGHNTLFIIEDEGIISWRGFVGGQWSWGDLCETDPGLFEADTWVHVAVTNDGDKFRIYVNGEKAAETNFQETDGGNTTYRIGSEWTHAETFAGLIDDYAVFSKALNAVDINLIMNQGVKPPIPPIPPPPNATFVVGEKMLWIDSKTSSIRYANLDGSKIADLISGDEEYRTDIAVDVQGRQMYWTSQGPGNTGKIRRRGFDSGATVTLVSNADFPSGRIFHPKRIALDVEDGKMYWTDVQTPSIWRATLDGNGIIRGSIKQLDFWRDGRYVKATDIAVDVQGRKMYWVDSDNSIYRADLDGNKSEKIVPGALTVDFPSGIALDMDNGKMYWAASNTDDRSIFQVDINSNNIQEVFTVNGGKPHDIALDVQGDKMYWTDGARDSIWRADLQGNNFEEYPSIGMGEPSQIALLVPEVGGLHPPIIFPASMPPGPKVRVIWYYAANDQLRGPEDWISRGFGDDYMTPDNASDYLGHVEVFFNEQLNLNSPVNFFERTKSNIIVTKIQSNEFFVDDRDLSNYNSTVHFKQTDFSDSGDFLKRVWRDITTNFSQNVTSYNTSNDIYLVLLQSNHGYLGNGSDTRSVGRVDHIGGRVAIVAVGPFKGDGSGIFSVDYSAEAIKVNIAHELGHNFGLFHDFSADGLIMSYKPEKTGIFQNARLDANQFSSRSKNWLEVHPAFNSVSGVNLDVPIKINVTDASASSGTPLTLNPLGPVRPAPASIRWNELQVSANSVDEYQIRLNIEDVDGLHHVELVAPPLKNAKGCQECSSDNISLVKHYQRPTNTLEFNITEWVKENQDLKESSLRTYIATIDKAGNILYFALEIDHSSAAPAPFAEKQLPKETALLASYPNPFNPETWIPYQLAKPAEVSLTIYDLQGRVVRTLALGHQRAGLYHVRSRAAYWDGRNAVGEKVASGVYFYTLRAGDFTATRKLVISK